MSVAAPLKGLGPVVRPSVADHVFDELHRQILTLVLKPGTKMSEVEVAKAMEVSRQPVRDAFYRLSKLGFLVIRPQRATLVSAISETAVFQARFIRSAIEAETVRVACEKLSEDDLDALGDIIELQRQAVEAEDPLRFHDLDDQFHKEICDRSGLSFAWEVIRENKAHMDRVRFLSLAFASRAAFGDHERIFAAMRKRDSDAAMACMHEHLGRIKDQISRIRADYIEFFAGESDLD
ncbi:MAG: GntR family transcriptional regulator [Rhodobacteraceae bacterium]|nr:GntR family transcriptional regulator [Paracoccaceae bacterium]